MWSWITFLGTPILVIVVAHLLHKRQQKIDAVLGEQGFRDPPVGDYLNRLHGGF